MAVPLVQQDESYSDILTNHSLFSAITSYILYRIIEHDISLDIERSASYC
jgi:hypothetical protein